LKRTTVENSPPPDQEGKDTHAPGLEKLRAPEELRETAWAAPSTGGSAIPASDRRLEERLAGRKRCETFQNAAGEPSGAWMRTPCAPGEPGTEDPRRTTT
jgi:hypothetical protein